MKSSSLLIAVSFYLLVIMSSCKQDGTSSSTAGPAPSFTVGVQEVSLPANFPALQSYTWARQGNQVLLFGGRTEGFHGLNQLDSIFRASKSNTTIYVVNLDDFSFQSLSLDLLTPGNMVFINTNMQFVQEGDTLFFAGGYGQQVPGNLQSNYTYNTITAISVSQMINIVAQQGNPHDAILQQAASPYVQVTGGEMAYVNGYLFLLFGQNYDSIYTAGKTGIYTSAVRRFRLVNNQVIDTSSFIDNTYHRRDLSMVQITQQNGNFYAAFGGVFTPDGDGYMNPVYMQLSTTGSVVQKTDTVVQMTNQYNCATASIYDAASNACFTILFGGIGQYQYHPETGKWENGDDGAKLPFVKTITQMVFQSGIMTQQIQIPPYQPELPAFIGASAAFFPDPDLILQGQTIDYSKITSGSMTIGVIYGGITSQKPTSSSLYPTSVTRKMYNVTLNKLIPPVSK